MLFVKPIRNRNISVVPPIISSLVAADQEHGYAARVERRKELGMGVPYVEPAAPA